MWVCTKDFKIIVSVTSEYHFSSSGDEHEHIQHDAR